MIAPLFYGTIFPAGLLVLYGLVRELAYRDGGGWPVVLIGLSIHVWAAHLEESKGWNRASFLRLALAVSVTLLTVWWILR